MRQLMSRMKEMTKTELSSFSHQWKPLPQQLVEIAPTPFASSEPKGMVKVPGGNFVFCTTLKEQRAYAGGAGRISR